LIDLKISAIVSVRGLGPRLPLPWTRTLTAVSFHVALSDDKHGMNFHLLGALNFAVLNSASQAYPA